MSQNQITGEIHQIPEAKTFPSGFTKRLCVLKYKSGEYENFLAVEFLKDKVDLLNGLQVGETITISYNEARSNESPKTPGQWFTSVTGWRIERAENAAQDEQPAPDLQHKQAGHPMAEKPSQAEELDDTTIRF